MISSRNKSISNWLDRLYSIKGLPPSDNNLNIDHYLNNTTQPSDSTRPSQFRVISAELENNQAENGGEGELDLRVRLQNTLCELFNMKSEGSSGLSMKKKKVPRKQVNPRCVEVAAAAAAEMASGSVNAEDGVGGKVVVENESEWNDGEDDDDDEGFVGYSKSDVTVIDTSLEVWKSDKWVFRKNDVWKVREKRGKCRSLLKKRKRKKRKEESGGDNAGVKKKAKISRLEVRELLKDSNFNHQVGRRKELPLDNRDYFSQVPKKRINFSRTPKKFKRVTTPVVVFKGLPTASNNEGKLSNIPAEDIQRQHQA